VGSREAKVKRSLCFELDTQAAESMNGGVNSQGDGDGYRFYDENRPWSPERTPMDAWWQELPIDLKVLYLLGYAGLLAMIIETVLMFFGFGDHGGDVGGDGAGGAEHASGLEFFSVRSITGFFTGGAWTTIWLRNAEVALPVALAAGVAVGIAFAWFLIFLMRQISRLAVSGSLQYSRAVGQIGMVRVPIPPAAQGEGQIEVYFQHRMVYAQAITRGAPGFATGQKVQVVAALNQNTLIVEAVP